MAVSVDIEEAKKSFLQVAAGSKSIEYHRYLLAKNTGHFATEAETLRNTSEALKNFHIKYNSKKKMKI
jgi:hypothetical protein